MARQATLIGQLSQFIRKHPKMSGVIAFNLGVYAALATQRGIANKDVKRLSAKVIGLMPSMDDLGSYMPFSSTPAPKARLLSPAGREKARRTIRKIERKMTRKAARKKKL
jgi:hypothetical protein